MACFRIGLAVALALTWTARAAAAPDRAAARAFVQGVYRAYCLDCDVNFDRQAPRQLTPRLLALVRRDQQLAAPAEIGALDGDPICDCQDYDIRDVRIDIRAVGPDRATAVAHFRNFDSRNTVTLDLRVVHGRWRIDNIRSKTIPDLAAFLREHAGGR